ncbi:MAG: hypothetical protein JWO31_2338 [Phycisphaerales bacterium]|nr:hypothetical protein [Phycisphaerales bacterium]
MPDAEHPTPRDRIALAVLPWFLSNTPLKHDSAEDMEGARANWRAAAWRNAYAVADAGIAAGHAGSVGERVLAGWDAARRDLDATKPATTREVDAVRAAAALLLTEGAPAAARVAAAVRTLAVVPGLLLRLDVVQRMNAIPHGRVLDLEQELADLRALAKRLHSVLERLARMAMCDEDGDADDRAAFDAAHRESAVVLADGDAAGLGAFSPSAAAPAAPLSS